MSEMLSIIGWRDLLDIAIVSAIIYKLLNTLRGTRAAKMMIGLLLLLAAAIASRNVPLYTLDWLLQGFWAYVVIVMIVIFQPEIRRALARMGEAKFLTRFTAAEVLRSREQLIKAVVGLAQKKIGALIVLERDTDLSEYVELGTNLDARVTQELLTAIFHPTSPMHDGAVVIRGNRIVAAGCFLPIALTHSISKALGTRHRAALGITEETDCVVLIVSEETADISMSMGGRLEQHLDMGALRDRLEEVFSNTSQPAPKQKVGA